MRKILAAALLFLASCGAASAQAACPAFSYGLVLTAGQWQACFDAKQNVLGYTPVNKAGDTMLGRLVTAAPGSNTAGLNLTPGSTPGSPVNGDIWNTSSGFFVRSNGVTIGPLTGPGAGSFSATSPIKVTFPSSVVTYSFDFTVANTFLAQQTNQGATTTSPGWYAQIAGDTFSRVRVGLNATDVPSVAFGPGNLARDAFIERVGAGSLRFGAPDTATAVAQTLSVQNVAAGTSNTAGANLTFAGSRGTGTGAGGAIVFQTAPAGSTGTAQNALVEAGRFSGAGALTLTTPLGTASGGTGAGTFAAGRPLIGNGTGTIAQGTLSSTSGSTVFANVDGVLTPGDCIKVSSTGGMADQGATCGASANQPVNQYFSNPSGSTITLTNTPLPTAAGLLQLNRDGVWLDQNTYSVNTGTGVVTFNTALPAGTQQVAAYWFAPSTLAGVGSLGGATGAVSLGNGLAVSGQVLSATGFYPSTTGGTANAIVLTPTGGAPAAYANYQHFGFVAATTSTNSGTLQVGSLAALNTYRPDGSSRLFERDIEAGVYYDAVYNSALNSGSGGFTISSTPTSLGPQMSNDGSMRIASPGTPKTYLLTYANGNGGWFLNATSGRWEWCFVNGAYQTIDTTNTYVNGVSGQALAANSSYYIYGWTTGGGILQVNHILASSPPTTGGSPNDVTGYNFAQSGQQYREIGAIFTDASGVVWKAGSNGVTYNGIASFYQRQRLSLVMSPQPNGTWSSSSWGEINSNNRLYAWWWGDGAEGTASLSGSIQCNTISAEVDIAISINGANPPLDYQHITCTATNTYFAFNTAASIGNFAEGPQNLQIWARSSSGTVSLQNPITFLWNITE